MRSVTRFICILVFINIIVGILSKNCFAKEILLKDGTPVTLRLTEEVSSSTKDVGETINFEVVKDVIVDGEVLIKAGTPAYGLVNVAEKPGALGKEGRIGIIINSTKSVDNKEIRLRSSLRRTGEDRLWLSAGLAYGVCPACGLMPGGKPSFAMGTEIKAYTENDVRINVE